MLIPRKLEGDSAFGLLALLQFRYDCLPGRSHQRGGDAAEKRESYKGADQDPGLRQDHQRDADRRQEELDGAQELAAIENVGQDAGGDGEQEDWQRAGCLDHRHCGWRCGKIRH